MKITADGIKEFIIKHYQYFGVGVLFICLVVVLLIFSSGKNNDDTIEAVDTVSQVSANGSEIPVPETELEVDAYADVNTLVADYFTAMAAGDTDKLSQICSELDDTEKIRIQKKAEFTENYQNFTCYTKPGPMDKSYIVFAYYEIKFKNIETLAPGLTSLYIGSKDDGSLYVYDGDLDENVNDYIRTIAAQDDVVELLNKVDTKYSEAAASDDALKVFMDALPKALDDAVTAELAAREANGDETVSQQMAQGDEAATAETGTTTDKVKTKESVNVRKSASETGDKLGKALAGETFTRLEVMDNGWSKIQYQDQEAYIKSEFLEAVSEGDVTEDTAEATDTESTTSESAIGKVKIKETVKIRKGASKDSEQLGSAYQGETYDLIMKQADGWCKITYEGQTAYVNSDYVEIQ